MPYKIVQVSKNPPRYSVVNKLTGMKHSLHTTLEKAKAQMRLLDSLGY